MNENEEIEEAAVFYRAHLAGALRKTRVGYEFEYHPGYLGLPGAQPISLSLPLREDKYESSRLFSFFNGLLPEGWLLDVTCAVAKIDRNNKFRLLLHTGGDPVGAVSIKPVERFDE